MVAGSLTRLAWASTEVLGQSDPTTPSAPPNPNSSGAEFGKAAPIALVIILLLLVSLILLIRSMNGHVKKLPESFGSTGADGPTGRGPG